MSEPEPRHLLLIDDDDMVNLTFREYLVRGGCEVDAAADLKSARRRLAEQSYSAIWLDLHLTGTSPAECLAFLCEMRGFAGDAKIIAVSGYATTAVETQAGAAGADWFLKKPFDARTVAALLVA
ncbi:MAG TPA: response regulator [Thermoanaerobaculia bacterium]